MSLITVSQHQPNWASRFEAEALGIHRALLAELVYTHHIGSTAVPGLAAKPIIDIMPVVRDIAALDGLTPSMERLGYEARGECGTAGRRYFVKRTARQELFHVHAYEVGHADVERHLAVRDYLRQRPDAAARYAKLKLDLAGRFPDDPHAYGDGKDGFIREAEAKALDWWRRVPMVLVTGPVGVGKTTLASALADALVEEGVPTAFVDGDALAEVHPAGPGDAFGEGVLVANLEAVWKVYRAAGARCLTVANVVESEDAARRLAAAVPGSDLTVVRLDAPLSVMQERVARRESGPSEEWHRSRAEELRALYAKSPIGDVILNADQPLGALVAQALIATRVVDRLRPPVT
jgi:GrpB-like predicted nucleotidyltransferase (UPF0157 family)/energy-coupling factor transporter ATP-binding protein EcfA2